jgi:arylsulfatase A-like enzyme
VDLPATRDLRAGKLSEELTTLAEILAAEGYRTAAFVAGPWLHRSFGLLQGFETKDDDVSSLRGRTAQEITDRAIEWLRGLEGRRPYFLFVNYFDPHAPYQPLAGYDDLPRAREPAPSIKGLVAGERRLTAVEREILVDRYDGEIRYMDHHLGRLLHAVESTADGSRVLIIVTADHGESFGEGGRFGHTFWLSEELLRVPLIVRYPDGRRAGRRDASPIQLTDVLPLVATELGLSAPPSLEGVAPGARSAAFAEIYRLPRARIRFGEHFDRDLGAAIRWPHKLVRSSRGERTLFELEGPLPLERALTDPEIAGNLTDLLDGHERSLRRAKITPPEVDPQTAESLRRLGYVE